VRSWFSGKEWERLLKVSSERIKAAKSARLRWEREQLHDFMLFSVHSGLRQGELMSVRRKDVEVFVGKDDDRNKDYLMVNVRGKTGERRVVAMMGAVRAFERLCERNNLTDDDVLFPQNHRDGLNELLKVANLKYDSMGRTRNSKSFRHTYIMTRILKSGGRADLMKLARNCGVSPEVINRHYPQGRAGDSIPLGARIFAVADVFDALTSERPYKKPMTVERTLAILEEGRGSHFDGEVLNAFRGIVGGIHSEVAPLSDSELEHLADAIIRRHFKIEGITAS
jgi:hypothetical protein